MKKKLGFWEIWNMSFGFLGIQFGFALQGGFMSRIFQTLGASIDDIPILWVAAPLTGLIIQPIIGYFSDRTWHPKLGRRRPYFLVGAILASLALFIMPNSPVLWFAAGMLWIMDASINVSTKNHYGFVLAVEYDSWPCVSIDASVCDGYGVFPNDWCLTLIECIKRKDNTYINA